jgi:hypothetical protein
MNAQEKRLKPNRCLVALLCGIAMAQCATAQDFIKGGEDHVTFNLGGILNQFSTTVRLNGSTGPGTPVDLEGHGLDNNLSSILASGTWRWADRHRSDFMYFRAKRSANKQYDRDIVIGDNTFQANADIDIEAKAEYLLLDYRYSFVKSEAWEFAGVLGVYAGRFNFDASGTLAVSGGGSGGGAGTTATSSSSTTVPLPLIGVSADWYIEPRWKVSSMLEGMKAKIGDVDGHMVVFQLGTDYMITRNWGLGISYLYSTLDVDVSKNSFNGKIDWSSNAILAYATLKF